MNDEFGNDVEGSGRSLFKVLSERSFRGTSENTKNLSEDIRCTDRDANGRLPNAS
jgi:hypothetical protein